MPTPSSHTYIERAELPKYIYLTFMSDLTVVKLLNM